MTAWMRSNRDLAEIGLTTNSFTPVSRAVTMLFTSECAETMMMGVKTLGLSLDRRTFLVNSIPSMGFISQSRMMMSGTKVRMISRASSPSSASRTCSACKALRTRRMMVRMNALSSTIRNFTSLRYLSAMIGRPGAFQRAAAAPPPGPTRRSHVKRAPPGPDVPMTIGQRQAPFRRATAFRIPRAEGARRPVVRERSRRAGRSPPAPPPVAAPASPPRRSP